MDIRWFKQWKKYVGYDSWDTLNAGDETYNPGPIDNSALLKGENSVGCLRLLLLFYTYDSLTWEYSGTCDSRPLR